MHMANKGNIGIIGGGFSGMSAACYMARLGYKVILFEKNEQVGGRARVFEEAGFKFDMGPSWYWMPDVFENFFRDFGKEVKDYYALKKLTPGFQVIFSKDSTIKIDGEFDKIVSTFDSIESGSGEKLRHFISHAEYKYKISMSDLVFKPAHSFTEFLKWNIIKEFFKTNLFSPLSREIRKSFKDFRLVQIMEFPVIFLGALADRIPALYSIMNYAALKQGTFYPEGGMTRIIEGMKDLALDLGVEIITNAEVEKIQVEDSMVNGIVYNNTFLPLDAVIASADYHHVESKLIDNKYRNYNQSYWKEKVFAPSSILFYLGIDKKLKKLEHHNLFFDTDFAEHGDAIYKKEKWVEKPLFYACCPSKTDSTVAPEGKENLFLLIPYSVNLIENAGQIDSYFDNVLERLEDYCDEDIRSFISFKRAYAGKNFVADYNAFKGNAYGLANTLLQTAFLKPKMQNKKLKNLMYTGQLTVPGPGIPPSLISGKIVAREMDQYLNSRK